MSTQPLFTSRVLPAVAITSALFLATPHAALGLESTDADAAGSLAQNAINAGLSDNLGGTELLTERVEDTAGFAELDDRTSAITQSETVLDESDSVDTPVTDGGGATKFTFGEDLGSDEESATTSEVLLVAAVANLDSQQTTGSALSAPSSVTTVTNDSSESGDEVEDTTPHVEANKHTFVLDSAVDGRGVMDVRGGSKSSRAYIQLYLSNGTAAQQWYFVEAGTYNGNTYYTIYSDYASQMVLDVAGAKVANRTNIQQYKSNGTNAQKWRIDWIDEAAGLAVLRSRLNDDYVIDVAGAKSGNGTNLQLYKWNKSNAQKWYLIDTATGHAGTAKVSDLGASAQQTSGSYRILSQSNGKAVDVKAASTVAGATVQVYKANGTIAQGFYLSSEKVNGTTYYRLRNDKSGLSVTVTAGDIVPGTTVTQQASKAGNLAQLWTLVSDGANGYYFVNAQSHHVLTNTGSGLTTAYASRASKAQRWKLENWTPSMGTGVYRINSGVGNGQTLSIQDSSSDSGKNVQNGTWADSLYQRWYVERSGNGYTVQDMGSGKYLATDSKGNILQTTAKATWSIAFTGGDNATSVLGYRLVASDNRVADVQGGKSANGTNVRLYNSNGTKAQVWSFVSVDPLGEDGWFEFAAMNNGALRLNVQNNSGADGANVQVATSNGSDAQKWHITRRADGNYRIVSGISNRALAVDSKGNVIQATTTSQTIQAWRVSYSPNTGYVFTNVSTGKVLDIVGGRTTSGTNVQVYKSNGTIAQQWSLTQTSPSRLGAAIQRFTDEMMRIALDNSHGYDQAYRWGERGDYDCSSLVITCLRRAGFKTGSSTYTGNMRDNLSALGWQVLPYQNVNGFQKGDILLNDYTHTAAMYSNTIEVAARGGNEFGGVTGGRPGDQTGEEIAPRNISWYTSGGGTHSQWWNVILRPTSSTRF